MEPPSPDSHTHTFSDGALELRTTYPAIAHFAVLTALLAPLAVVPYLLSRRHISSLSRRLDTISVTTAALRKELEASAPERAKWKKELSAATTDVRKQAEYEWARQKKELSATVATFLETSEMKQKEELLAATTALREELKASVIENAKRKEELNHTSALLEAAKKEVTRLHHSIEQLRAEHEASGVTTESMQQLLQERQADT